MSLHIKPKDSSVDRITGYLNLEFPGKKWLVVVAGMNGAEDQSVTVFHSELITFEEMSGALSEINKLNQIKRDMEG